MAKGRYEKAAPLRGRRRLRLLLPVCILLILTLAAGTTLAYFALRTDPVQNSFEPMTVTSFVNVSGDVISVSNTGTVEAYIRAAVVVNWMDDEGNVRGLAPGNGSDYSLALNLADWTADPDTGFYYYNKSVAAGAATDPLVTAITELTEAPSGYGLTVEVVAEAIQAIGVKDGTGEAAFRDAWGIASIGN